MPGYIYRLWPMTYVHHNLVIGWIRKYRVCVVDSLLVYVYILALPFGSRDSYSQDMAGTESEDSESKPTKLISVVTQVHTHTYTHTHIHTHTHTHTHMHIYITPTR